MDPAAARELLEQRARTRAREQAIRRRLTGEERTYARWLLRQADGGTPLTRAQLAELEARWNRTVRSQVAAVETGVQQAAAAGERDAVRLMGQLGQRVAGGPEQVGTAVIREALRPGARLPRLLERRFTDSPAAPARAAAMLRDGFAAGKGPRELAETIAEATRADLRTVERIARTEMLRTHRETTRAAYQQDDAVSGWRWLAAADDRTCAVCWALHGSEHRLDEPMPAHPNCRCAIVPILQGRAGELTAIEPGPDRFARLPAAQQRQILGPGAHDRYQRGELDLPDLVAVRRNPVWGDTVARRPLRDLPG